MKKLITTIILLTALSLPACAGDGSTKDIAWKGSQGFIVGMVCVGLDMKWYEAYLTTLALSAIKELADQANGYGFSNQDCFNRANGTLFRYAIEWRF